MNYKEKTIKDKKDELALIAEKSVSESGLLASDVDAHQIAVEIINNFTRITAPEPPEHKMHMTTIHHFSGGFSGQNLKPGNIVLKMSNIMYAVTNGALAFSGAMTGAISPRIACVFASILLWKDLYSSAKVDLSEKEAIVLYTMWNERDEDNCVPKENLLNKTNKIASAFSERELSELEFRDCLDKLCKISCIEQLSSDESKWWLREWVRVTFR